jgi:preprotein translocase subunit SecD
MALAVVLLLSACGDDKPRESIQQLRVKTTGVVAEVNVQIKGAVDRKLKQLHKTLVQQLKAKGLPVGRTYLVKQNIRFQFNDRKAFAQAKDFIGEEYWLTEKIENRIYQYHLKTFISETRGRYFLSLELDSNGMSSIRKSLNAKVENQIRKRLQSLQPKSVHIERLSINQFVVFVAGIKDVDKVYDTLRNRSVYLLASARPYKESKTAKKTEKSTDKPADGKGHRIRDNNIEYEILTAIRLDGASLHAVSIKENKRGKAGSYSVYIQLAEKARNYLASDLKSDKEKSLLLVRRSYVTSLVLEGSNTLVDTQQSDTIVKQFSASDVVKPLLLSGLGQQQAQAYHKQLGSAPYPVPVHVSKESVFLSKAQTR